MQHDDHRACVRLSGRIEGAVIVMIVTGDSAVTHRLCGSTRIRGARSGAMDARQLELSVEPADGFSRLTAPIPGDFDFVTEVVIAPDIAARVQFDDWNLSGLVIDSEADFDARMRVEGLRMTDKETLLFCARQTYHRRDLPVWLRACCYVIFAYKCLELDRIAEVEASLPDLEDLRAQAFAHLHEKRRADPRRDLYQQILSLKTVAWHIGVALGRVEAVETELREIAQLAIEKSWFGKLGEANNIMAAMLMLARLRYRLGHHAEAVDCVEAMHRLNQRYIVALSRANPPNPMPTIEYSKAVAKLGVALFVRFNAAREIEPGDAEKSPAHEQLIARAARFAAPAHIFEHCSRVRGPGSFRARFLSFLDPAAATPSDPDAAPGRGAVRPRSRS